MMDLDEVKVGEQQAAALTGADVEPQDPLVASVRDVQVVVLSIEGEAAAHLLFTLEHPLDVAEHLAIAVVLLTRAVVLFEVVAVDRPFLSVEGPIDVLSVMLHAHAKRREVEHVHMRPVLTDIDPENAAVSGPQGRSRKIFDLVVKVGCPGLRAGPKSRSR